MVGSLSIRLLQLAGSKLPILAVTLLALGTAVTAPGTVLDRGRGSPFVYDYAAFDTAGAMVREGRAGDLYDIQAQQQTQLRRTGGGDPAPLFVFLYPPPVAAAFAPLSWLGIGDGYLVFAGALLAVLATIGWLITRLTADLSKTSRLLLVVCALGSTAFSMSVLIGQLTPLLLAIVLCALVLLRAGRAGYAGIVLGLLVVKPHFALVALIVALAAGQRKVCAGIAGVGALLVVASVAVVGLDGAADYVSLTREATNRPSALNIYVAAEQHVYGLVATVSHVHGGASATIAQSAIGLVALALAVRALRRRPYVGTEGVLYAAGVASLLVLVAAPHVQYYDLAFLLVPALFVAHRADAARDVALRGAIRGLLVCSVVFVEAGGMLASVNVSVSAPVLFALLLMLCEWQRFEGYLASRCRTAALELKLLPAAADGRLVAQAGFIRSSPLRSSVHTGRSAHLQDAVDAALVAPCLDRTALTST